MTIENVAENQGTLGRLKPVSRVRNPFKCDECKGEFEVGSPAFSQSDYRGDGFFPVQRRICKSCGDKLISEGTEVKIPVKKPKKLKGCGKPTDLPKPDRSGDMWNCGDIAPIIGQVFCTECYGLEGFK